MKATKQARFSYLISETPDNSGVVGFVWADSPEIAIAMRNRIQGLNRFRNASWLLAQSAPERIARPMYDVALEHGYPENVVRFALRQAV
jgi:hypothetical protein